MDFMAIWHSLTQQNHLTMAFAVCRAALYVIVGFGIARLISASVVRFYQKRNKYNHASLIRKILFYLIFSLFLISALRELGFDLKVLLGATGLLTVAVGFASQTSASNLISGLFLIGERAFTIGDIISINNITGEVLAIDLFSVKLRQGDNTIVRIPNEMMIKTQVINLSYYSQRRLECLFSVPGTTDIAQLRKSVLAMLKAEDLCLNDPPPVLIIKELADNAIKIQLFLWSTQTNFNQLNNIIYEKILALLHSQQISVSDNTLAVKLLSPETQTTQTPQT